MIRCKLRGDPSNLPIAIGLVSQLHYENTETPIDRREINGRMCVNAPMQRYAWLEHEEGVWHFLTDLFADPGESTRTWPDSLRALEELKKEGWAVISPYPGKSLSNSNKSAAGYGLMWVSS